MVQIDMICVRPATTYRLSVSRNMSGVGADVLRSYLSHSFATFYSFSSPFLFPPRFTRLMFDQTGSKSLVPTPSLVADSEIDNLSNAKEDRMITL
jgi:hypothetical protein